MIDSNAKLRSIQMPFCNMSLMTEARRVIDVINTSFFSGKILYRKMKFVTDNLKGLIYVI